MIEYNDSIIQSTIPVSYSDKLRDRVDLFPSGSNIIKHNNDFIMKDDWDPDTKKLNISDYLLSTLTIYYPDHSIDTYTNTDYILSVSTYVGAKFVGLGSFLLNRRDAVANDMVFYNSQKYFEHSDIQIINPYHIIYSDDWKEFRTGVCEEVEREGVNYNNSVGGLCFTLYPVIYNNGRYIIRDGCSGGQNGMSVSLSTGDYLGMKIGADYSREEPIVKYDIYFNSTYSSDIYLYMKETYGVTIDEIKVGLVINSYISEEDKISIEKNLDMKSPWFTMGELKSMTIFSKDHWPIEKDGSITGGLMMTGYLSMRREGKEVLYILSQPLYLTKEIMKYFITTPHKRIDLNSIDMNIYNITAINKIENNVVKLDNISDAKTNIVQPVFIRVRDAQDVVIHSGVTENICINLDQYKANVKTFVLKIGEKCFNQIGSTSAGIIFKVLGNMIDSSIGESGVYYILDQNFELVTTGKYIKS